MENDMRLHNYLEQVIGNKIAISVLRALVRYKGKIYTVRGLAEDAGASHPEVSKTLNELEKFGIVQIQPVGRAYQVSLNEKSYVLSKIIKPILKAEEKTLDEVTSILKNHLSTKKIISAVIFGSVAKRAERDDSDIDVLVISNDLDHSISAISDAAREISQRFQNKVSHIIFSESQLQSKKKGNTLVQSILDDHILICGKELASVLK
ncbi:MAG: nucleotidyltransferase domain-containing protein [Candidatus Nitrosotenuis sp.]